jgi:hypothetical protein
MQISWNTRKHEIRWSRDRFRYTLIRTLVGYISKKTKTKDTIKTLREIGGTGLANGAAYLKTS